MKIKPSMQFLAGVLALVSCVSGSPAWALTEVGYERQYATQVLPFMRTAQTFHFLAHDGLLLKGVRFNHPNSVGTILIVNGRSESWVKYGEVFYDLYQSGFSIVSYDHRGQGLSPHLVKQNPQIGHVGHFSDYITDLKGFVETVLKPEIQAKKSLYLLAHSMGGGIAAGYFESNPSPFKAAVLSAPMLQIDTKPYSEKVALKIVSFAVKLGRGEEYALGQEDADPFPKFENNGLTSSRARYAMSVDIGALYPQTLLGGPSSGWVLESLLATKKITSQASKIRLPIMIFQAGQDKVVKNLGETTACANAKNCNLVIFPTAEHEILMEKDSIRDRALREVKAFFTR